MASHDSEGNKQVVTFYKLPLYLVAEVVLLAQWIVRDGDRLMPFLDDSVMDRHHLNTSMTNEERVGSILHERLF